MKDVGVKIKVRVVDDDGGWSYNDLVDKLVYHLNPTPSRSASSASWTTIYLRGQRSQYTTQSVVARHFVAWQFILFTPSLRQSTSRGQNYQLPQIELNEFKNCFLNMCLF